MLWSQQPLSYGRACAEVLMYGIAGASLVGIQGVMEERRGTALYAAAGELSTQAAYVCPVSKHRPVSGRMLANG